MSPSGHAEHDCQNVGVPLCMRVTRMPCLHMCYAGKSFTCARWLHAAAVNLPTKSAAEWKTRQHLPSDLACEPIKPGPHCGWGGGVS